MTLKQTITEELLDSIADPGGLEEVQRKYSKSKGPYYLALAEATSQLLNRLQRARQQTASAESHKASLDHEVKEMEEKRKLLDGQIVGREQRVRGAESRLLQVQGLLDQADVLTKAGLGEEELRRLSQLLAEVAAGQGALPEEGVAQFFDTVSRYEQIVSLDLEAKRSEARAEAAKAEAERWQAEARGRESRTKARVSAIDMLEKLLSQGVRAQDLPHWQLVLNKAGVTAEELSGSLNKFGSMEALTRQRGKRAKELKEQTSELETQAKALTEQRDNAQAAIQEIREYALEQVKLAGLQLSQEITEAGDEAKEYMEGIALAGANYGNLRSEAAALREYVEVARVLQSVEPDNWQALSRDTILHLLLGVSFWVQMEGRNPELPPPGGIRNHVMVPSYCRISLADALIWAMSGVFTEEERQALAPGR